MTNRLRVSRILILNTLCCLVAACAAYDASWLIAYRGVIRGLILDMIKLGGW